MKSEPYIVDSVDRNCQRADKLLGYESNRIVKNSLGYPRMASLHYLKRA